MMHLLLCFKQWAVKVLSLLQICNTSNIFRCGRFLSAVALLGLSGVVQAQQISLISSDGSRLDIPDSLIQQIQINPISAVDLLTTYFADNGYLNVKVKQESESSYSIQKGAAFALIVTFTEQGEIVVNHKLPRYTKHVVEQEINAALDSLINEGFYFAEAEIVEFLIDTTRNQVLMQAELMQGDLVYLNGIIASGNRLNNDAYIAKISGLGDSLLATPSNLDQLSQNLYQSELFDEINTPKVRMVENKALAFIEVTERRLNQFDGVLGYVPDANGNGQIVGDLTLNLWSVFAEGNGIDFTYRRLEPEVSRLNAQIKQYWIGSLPIGLDAALRFFQNDTTYQHREYSLGGFYQVSPQLKVTSQFVFEGTTGSNSAQSIEPGGNRTTGALGFEISTLNRIEVPTSGFKGAVTLGVSDKTLAIDANTKGTQQHLKVSFVGFVPMAKQSVLVGRVNSFLLNGDHITDSDLFRFGGAKSLRGFSEEQFSASQLAWADLEYRFLTDRNSYLFTFLSIGTYHRPKLLTETTNQFKQTNWLQSFGFGLSYRIKVGRLSFSYAISPKSGFGNGKVHVALTTRL